jgi:PLP dependent protein
MADIATRLETVRARIRRACTAAGRPPECVTLVAVSKSFAAMDLMAALAAGQRDFGESYLQEALEKMAAVNPGAGGRPGPLWHFIGPVQSNKTAALARHFDWVHSVDREKIARRLSEQRPPGLPLLNVCVQVNISGETTKAGVAPEAVSVLCRTVAALPRLKLRGLMAIPAPATSGFDVRNAYRRLRKLFESLRRDGLDVDTLSAGMSDDLEAAIAEGSTMVRIGTAIFGTRPG